MKITKSQIRQIIQEEIANVLEGAEDLKNFLNKMRDRWGEPSEQEPEPETWEGVENVPTEYRPAAEALFQRMKKRRILPHHCYAKGFTTDECRDQPMFWLVEPSDRGYGEAVELENTHRRLSGEV